MSISVCISLSAILYSVSHWFHHWLLCSVINIRTGSAFIVKSGCNLAVVFDVRTGGDFMVETNGNLVVVFEAMTGSASMAETCSSFVVVFDLMSSGDFLVLAMVIFFKVDVVLFVAVNLSS